MEDHSSNESIGGRIARLRKQQHLSQAQLAEKIHSSSKHVSEIERGVTGISIDTQVMISQELNCSLDYLIKGDEYKSVDSILPAHVVKILHSQNEQEITLLLDYLNMYERIHKSDNA